MSRPTIELTDEMVTARLESGDHLSVARLARRLQMREESVRKKLIQMLAEGKIMREREDNNPKNAYLYFVEKIPAVIAGGAFEVAAPLITVVMTGNLTGYDASFTRMRDLCMSIRRAA